MKDFRSRTHKIRSDNVVPGTYLQAAGVHSETHPNMLIKLAGHEAAYIEKVAIYKKHMDRKIRDLSRDQKLMLKRSPLRQISNMMNSNASNDDDETGNITPIHLPAIIKIHKNEEITIGSVEHFANQRKKQLKQARLRSLYRSKWRLVQDNIPKLASSKKQKKEKVDQTATIVRFKLSDKTETNDADGISVFEVERKEKDGQSDSQDKKGKNGKLRPVTYPSSILKDKKSSSHSKPTTAPDNCISLQSHPKLPGGLRLPPLNEMDDSPKIQHNQPSRSRDSPPRKRIVSLDSYLDDNNKNPHTFKKNSLPTLIPNPQLVRKNDSSYGYNYENSDKNAIKDGVAYNTDNENIKTDSYLEQDTPHASYSDNSGTDDEYDMFHQIAENKRRQAKTLNTRRISWKEVLPKIRECLHFSKDTSS